MTKTEEQFNAGEATKMTIWGLLKNIIPYVLPYKWLVTVTLVLTLVGSLMAQVNAVVLDRAVDSINALIQQPGGFSWGAAVRILTVISIILLGKEVVAAVVTFFQRYYGERMRIMVSRDLSLRVVERILSFRMAFFSGEGNETGRLQSRIDRGIMSLSNTVNNFFIEILPLFTSAVLALALMFMANVYVGLVALCIVPIYFYVTYIQAKRMKGGRRSIFGGHQAVSQGILNIIESMTVIKSFNREQIEADRQADLQRTMTGLQLNMRKQSYMFNGLKSFLEQIGTVLIIILTAYLVLIDYPGMTIGKIMYHVMLFANVSAPIRQLHRIYDDMNDALIYAEGFFGILQAEGEVEPTGSHRPETVEGTLADALKKNGEAFVSGALTDTMVVPLLRSGLLRGGRLVVKDPSKVLLSTDTLDKLVTRNVSLETEEAARTLCVTINPVSAYGWKFDKDAFMRAMSEAVDAPVINVKEELA